MQERLKERVEKEAEALGEKAGSLWALKAVPKIDLAKKVWTNSLEDDVFGRAAQLAYYFFFAIFPGLIFLSSVLGLMGRAGSSLIESLLANLSRLLPPSAYEILLTAFQQTTRASGAGKLAVGILIALWSATAGMTAIQDTLNVVYKAKEARPLWKWYANAIVLTLVSFVLASIAISILLGGTALTKLLGLGLILTWVVRIVMWPLAFAMLAMLFAVTYYYAPDVKEARWQWITPGAVIGILGWIAASIGLRVYLHFFNTYSKTYGSLGAVIILLTWFYISGLMLLVGAEVNSAIEETLTPARRKAAEAGQISAASAPPAKEPLARGA